MTPTLKPGQYVKINLEKFPKFPHTYRQYINSINRNFPVCLRLVAFRDHTEFSGVAWWQCDCGTHDDWFFFESELIPISTEEGEALWAISKLEK